MKIALSAIAVAGFATVLGLMAPGAALAEDDACAERLQVGQAYKNYRDTAKALRGGAAPDQVSGIACYFDGPVPGDTTTAYQALVSGFFHPNVLYDFLDKEARSAIGKAPRRHSAVLAWGGGYFAEAALTAYERTGDRRFLDLFADYFRQVVALRDDKTERVDDYRDRVVKSWGEFRDEDDWDDPPSDADAAWVAHVTHAARIGLGAVRFAEIVRGDPKLAAYGADADAFVLAIEEALAEFDEDCRPVEGLAAGCWYIRPMTGKPEATNHIHTLASVWLVLAGLDTDDADAYRSEVERVISVFRQGVVEESDGTVHWRYYPYFAEQVGNNGREFSERIWKASQTAPLIQRAYAAGYDIPVPLVDALTKTFLTHILRDNEIMRNVTSIQSAPISAEDGDLSHVHGIVTWLEYADHDPEIAERIRTVVGARPDLFPRGWFESTNIARGYAHFLEPAAL